MQKINNEEITTIVLAAGDGTRMKSSLPKLMHQVAGLPILAHVLKAAIGAGTKNLGVITAPNASQLSEMVKSIAPNARIFEQVERKGTAHAAQMAKDLWSKAKGYVIVVYGDHPLLRAQNFELILEQLKAGKDASILGFEPNDPAGYGRFITDGDKLLNIVEHKDATDEQRKINLCNACILGFKAEVFKEIIEKIGNDNAQNEYYLGDLVPLANQLGHDVSFVLAPSDDVIGVNDRSQLAIAENLYQNRLRQDFMRAGITLKDPQTTYFSYDTKIASDVCIEPNVIFGEAVEVGQGANILGFCHIVGAKIGKNANIGPFARLRPDANLGEGVKVGNFVEVKKAKIGAGAKLNHLSYIGDADVGQNANVGAGTITCNYDGINKHRTIIGQDVFVGSNSSLVAPIEIGKGAYIASGSVITSNVEVDALAIARSKQVNKTGFASKLKARALAFKNKVK